MFLYFFSLVIIVFEAICAKLFYECFCSLELENRKIQRCLLLILLIVGFYICGLTLSGMIVAKQIVAVLLVSIVMHFYFSISMKKAVVLALFYQGLLLLVDYLAYVGNRTIISQQGVVQSGYEMEGNFVILFSKILLFLCILFLKKKFERKSTEILLDEEWMSFLFFPLFTIITIIAMLMSFQYTENQGMAYTLYSIALGMVVMNMFVYNLINDIVVREAKLHEKEIMELQFKNQLEMYRSMSENYDMQRSKSHEFKNQILCIESLLIEHEYDKVGRYVNKISKSFLEEKNVINTNHVIINAILNAKYKEAINKHIVFVFKVNDLSLIRIEDEDLVVILANLINNAIEASEMCEDKKVIKFKFVIEDESIILSVKNTYVNPIILENNEIKTTKTVMPNEHGVGIKNIIRIVEKYKGEYVVYNNEKEFSFSILIPISE